MLPSNLLIARTRKGMIRPAFAYLSKSNLEITEALISIFQNHLGKKKESLLNEAKVYEELGFDYRFVRGLITLLERRCIFEVDSDVDPLFARRKVFELANRTGNVATTEKRIRVLKKAAGELGISLENLEKSLWSDLDSELLLKQFDPVDAEVLLKYYNLSLLQTLLFKAINLSFTIQSNWKNIFRRIKYLGLMYSIERSHDKLQFNVDGPLSLLKLTNQYGSAIAKLVPVIIAGRDWQLQAEIVKRQRTERRIFKLELDSKQDGDKIQSKEPKDSQQEIFDSAVEESFARRFQSLNTGWTLTREPEPLVTGSHLMLPDFSFEKGSVKAYLEVVGFWTPEYLNRKVEKLSQLREKNMMIAVDKKLACAKLETIKTTLVYYKKRIPLKPVLTWLEELERKSLVREVERLKVAPISVEDHMQNIDELAKRLATSREALVKFIEKQGIEGYRIIGNLAISEAKLVEIEAKIKILQDLRLSSVIKFIESEGIHEPYGILEALGYGIKWMGLDLDKTLVYKKKHALEGYDEHDQ